jgi:protoheme IX farnesyltransferase
MTDIAIQTRALLHDYLELCKPNVVALMILTSLIGMLLAVPGMVPWQILIFGNLGIALCAASAATVNHIVDRRIDLKMARTVNRPVAQGRIGNTQAVIFACAIRRCWHGDTKNIHQ